MTETIANDAVAKKIQAIQEEIERKNQEAEKLLTYLVEQQNLAKKEEELEEEDLKRQGIIVGQHIPSLPSKLNLDPNQLAEYENFSSTLLVAKELITQNRTNFLRRTGNLPISDLAELRRTSNQKYLSQQDPEKPHYLAQTKSAKEREDRNTLRFGETIQEVKKSASLHTKVKDETILKKPKDGRPKLTTKERLENEAVVKGLQHKMNYLRNPRNNPNSVTKMLNKPKDFFARPPEVPEDAEKAPEGRSVGGADGSVSAGGGSSLGEIDETESASSKIKSKYAKFIKLNNNPLFVADPSSIYFMDFEIGTKYTKNISFTNISAVSRVVRILPPKNKLFTISSLKYPPNCSNGVIAPGMAVSCTLTFVPDSLGDYEEFINVHTEAGSTQVQIIAQREPPNLDLPTTINIGSILVGDAQRSVISCCNTGGFGNFTIVEDDDPEECENNDLNSYNHECLRIPPFTIYPAQFALHKKESIDIVFEVIPLTLGVQTRSYKIVCDNGQVKAFTVSATSKEINLITTDINSVEFNDKDGSIYRDLYFANLVAGAEAQQSVSIVNDTGISVEYEWVWVDEHLPQEDWNRIGQDFIVRREQSQRPLSELQNSISDSSLPLVGFGAEAAEVDEGLLRSLKQTLHHDSDSAVKGNSVKEGPFEILPARGVLAGEGAAEFKFIFNPKQKLHSSLRAIMMIKSIPVASMPAHPEQAKLLQYLAAEGHGKYPRLRSWIEEMGIIGKVLPYRRPNGTISDEKKLIPLTSLINLIYSHMNEEEDRRMKETELPRINRWIRNILQHVFGIRKRDALAGDDGSTLGANNSSYSSQISVDTRFSKLEEQLLEIAKPKQQEKMEIFDWNIESNPTFPTLIPELILKYEEDQNPMDPDEEEEVYSDDESIVEEVDNQVGKTLRDLSLAEQEMCNEVYLDVFNVIKVLGEYISTQLDYKVSHEAVDYLKECAYTHLSSISFFVHGQSDAQRLLLSPPHVKIAGALTLGYECEASVKLINPLDSSLQLIIDKTNLSMKRKSTTSLQDEAHEDIERNVNNNGDPASDNSAKDSTDSLLENLELFCSQDRLLLMPHSQETIIVKLKILKLGHFEISLPVKSVDPTTLLETISIEVNVVGAKLRFNTAEVDIGLLGVGGENTYTLSFANEGDVPLMFVMKPTIHVDNLLSPNAAAIGSPMKRGSFFPDSVGGKESGGNTTDRSRGEQLSARSARSARSTHSQLSRASSTDFSIADSQATPGGDFKIELKNAVISVEPSTGVIQPHSTLTVSIISKAGKTPQRVRGMIESRIFDVEGKHELAKQYLNLRGEVQSPKVLLFPQHHNLGQVYIGRTVTFQFTLENICNLPTKFKFLRPGGQSSFFNFTLEPSKGSLAAKEKLLINGTFTSVATGLIDDILSCKMFGISTPLGVNLKALSKGISLEFINQKDNEPSPQPIASIEDVRYPIPNEKPPDPRPIEPIFLGNTVPLYERRKAVFFIRNLSAIPAPFEIQPKKFKVIEKKKRFGSRGGNTASASAASFVPPGGVTAPPAATSKPGNNAIVSNIASVSTGKDGQGASIEPPPTGRSVPLNSERKGSKHSISTASISTVATNATSVTTVPRTDLLLAPHEDGTNKFESEAGKKYIAFELNRREDRKYLKSGFGASYLTDITSGLLPPWGVQQVTIYAFNDIPGCYDDDIEILVRENEIIRKFYLPIKMAVIGCPIVIERHTMGMTEKFLRDILPSFTGGNKSPPVFEEEEKKYQLLQLGQVCEFGNLLKRHFIVKNYGSKNAKIKWNIRGIAAKANGPIKISFQYQPRPIKNSQQDLEIRSTDSSPSSSSKKQQQKNKKLPAINPNYRIKTMIRFWDDIAKESPFQIEPAKAILLPYEKQIFTVLLNHNTPARYEKAALTANIMIEDEISSQDTFLNKSTSVTSIGDGGVGSVVLNAPVTAEVRVANGETEGEIGLDTTKIDILEEDPKTKENKSSVKSSSTILSKSNKLTFELKLYVEGKYLHPELIIDKHTHAIPYENTLVPDLHAVRLTAKSTLLFTSSSSTLQGSIHGGDGTSSVMTVNPICSKLVNITNPLDNEVIIHLATEGALLIKDYEEKKDSSDLYANLNTKKNHKKQPGDKLLAAVPSSSAQTLGEQNSPTSPRKRIQFEDISPPAQASARSNTSGPSVKSQKNPQKEAKVLHLLPHQSTKFMIIFHPKKYLREQLMSTFGKEYGKPTEQKSFLIFTYPTGQALKLPVITSISTPFITGSAPRLYFGTCHVQRTCQGIFLLSNPTDVPARWTISHVPGGGQWKQSTAIRVKGFERIPEIDDPTVFQISPTNGMVEGPTVSVAATMAAPPKDYNRREDTIVPERLVQSSWATNTLSLNDTLSLKHQNTFPDPKANNTLSITDRNKTMTAKQTGVGGGVGGRETFESSLLQGSSSSSTNDIHYPMPITIIFTPNKNQKYCSRFRFSCEFANSFDLVLQGEGTYEESEHQPLNPIPRA